MDPDELDEDYVNYTLDELEYEKLDLMNGHQRTRFIEYYNENCLNKSECEISLDELTGWPALGKCAEILLDRTFFSDSLTKADKQKIKIPGQEEQS